MGTCTFVNPTVDDDNSCVLSTAVTDVKTGAAVTLVPDERRDRTEQKKKKKKEKKVKLEKEKREKGNISTIKHKKEKETDKYNLYKYTAQT